MQARQKKLDKENANAVSTESPASILYTHAMNPPHAKQNFKPRQYEIRCDSDGAEK